MAQLKTINAYLDEIKKLHRAGDSLPTTILAKLLSVLDNRLTKTNFDAMFFSRSISTPYNADQLYDECSALWIAFSSYYHNIVFNNDMLKNEFADIWKPYADDFSDTGLIIFADDFFRKCLIAAELLRRKQYGDYILDVLANKNIPFTSFIKLIELLPSLPLPSNMTSNISNQILNWLCKQDNMHSESEINKALTAFCEFNIKNGNIHDLVNQSIQLLKKSTDIFTSRLAIISKLLNTQQKMTGGIPLTDEQDVLCERFKSSTRRRFRSMEELNAIFSDPWKAVVAPSVRGRPLSDAEINHLLDLFASGYSANLKNAYEELILHCHHLTSDQLSFVINYLTNASQHTNHDIRDIACTLLVKLPIPLDLNQEVSTMLFNQLAHVDIAKINKILELTGPMSSLIDLKIEHFFNKLSFLEWNNLTIDVSSAVNFLLDCAFTNYNNEQISCSASWIEPTICLFERLIALKPISNILDADDIEDTINFIYRYCTQSAMSYRSHAVITRLLVLLVHGDKKAEVSEFIPKIATFTCCSSISLLYVDLLDKLLPATYENRHSIIQSLLRQKYTLVQIEDKVNMLLALTRRLTFEEQVKMTTLFSDELGVSAILINDLIHGRQKTEGPITLVMRDMDKNLNSDMVMKIKGIAFRA